MSLDVYLQVPAKVDCVCGGSCPCHDGEEVRTLFSANVTHNLGTMAVEADIYKCCWRPDENGITKAHQLIDPLTIGLAKLKACPAKFRAFNPSNGWGVYEGFVQWVEEYLAACKTFPDADVSVSR